MRKLPLGIQTFSEIINNNFLYIDKTKQIESLINKGKYYLFSRPRRFGKSLLLSTLKEIFKGNKELFKNLYIYDKIEWVNYPVIHFNFSSIKHSGTSEEFKLNIVNYIKTAALKYNITITKTSVGEAFSELIFELQKTNKVVVLIDDYDKPITDYLAFVKKAIENRDVLSEFYSSLNDNDQYIRFCFITGLSKVSPSLLFLQLPDLKDITLNQVYSTLCGCTQKELEFYFKDRLLKVTEKFHDYIENIKINVKYWYNGYSWDGITTVYNPYSLFNFFDDGVFNNYWFSTGTPTFLAEKIKFEKLKISEINNLMLEFEEFESLDPENLKAYALLFQKGYITITDCDYENKICALSYPNREVKESLLIHLLSSFSNIPLPKTKPLYIELKNYLAKNDIHNFIETLKSFFTKIPHTLHVEKEMYYQSLFYIILDLMEFNIEAEKSTSTGIIEGVFEFENLIYIIELKYLPESKGSKNSLKNEINLIKSKKYFEPFLHKNKSIKFLAIAVNKANIEYTEE
ncbi:MAG: AAA family ATPase [bacterium]